MLFVRKENSAFVRVVRMQQEELKHMIEVNQQALACMQYVDQAL